MKNLLNRNFYLIFLLDSVLVALAFYLAFAIRFEMIIPEKEYALIISRLPYIICLKMIVFLILRIYRGMWRYTSIIDFINIVKAVSVSSCIILVYILLASRFEGYPRSILIIDFGLTLFFILGLRMGIRLYYQRDLIFSSSSSIANNFSPVTDRKKLLIIGAGNSAEKVIREINDNKTLPYQVTGLIDDDSKKIGRSLHGIPVLGALIDLKEIIANIDPDEIVIAIPSATHAQMKRVVKKCQLSGVPFKTLPGMGEIIDDKVSIKTLRDVSYKDLLGRPPVRLELEKIGEVLGGKTVLITGAGGSIGSELCRQVIRFKPKLLILFDAGEENLYRIEMEIKHEIGFQNYVAVLGKVQIENLLLDIMQNYKPDIVFHAAAYKHVPLIESNPWEAVFNNIIATECLIKASIKNNVERFILVSTDKAVRPTNVMGTSKRITELLMKAYSSRDEHDNIGKNKTRFMAVRFGNVIGSSGSVIPLFKRQIEMGGAVTVTHPEMTRYFMSIEEAAQLILQAVSLDDECQGGEIFILEMGTPVKIDQMARDLIKLCGKEPETEVEIKYTGLRPGEKLYEELITGGEGIVQTKHEKIMVLREELNSRDEEEEQFQWLMDNLAELKVLARAHDPAGIRRKLHELVPEYTPTEEVHSVMRQGLDNSDNRI
jgi:FlaA1/EpsC-like NDP-sugar epimerase